MFGVHGSYDFISPQIFRLSSTALSIGTTYQWWLAREVALQGSDDTRGSEQIFRGNAAIVVCGCERNALGLQFVAPHRTAKSNVVPSRHQTVGTVSLTYTFLSDPHFGAVGAKL